MAGFPACKAEAADWSLKALFSETTLYNDNRKLELVSAGDVYAALSTLTLDLSAKAPAFHLDLTPTFAYRHYFGPGALPSDNGFEATLSGSAGYERKIGVNTFTLSGSATPQPTEISEETDSGKVTLNATRWTYSWQAGIGHDIDRLNSLKVTGGQTAVRFTGDDSPSFTPYDTKSLSGSWTRRLTKRTDMVTTVGVAHSEFGDPLKPDSTTYSATTGLSARPTRLLSFHGDIGVRTTDTEGIGTATGLTWNAGLDYALKSSKFSATASRSVAPSSLGEVQDTTAFGVSVDHKVAPRLTVVASYNYSTSASIDRNLAGLSAIYTIDPLSTLTVAANYNAYVSTTDDSRLLTISAVYDHRFSEALNAQLSYKYSQRDTALGDTASHAVTLTVTHPFDIFR